MKGGNDKTRWTEEPQKCVEGKETWGDAGSEGFRKPMTVYAGPREGQESAHNSANLKAKMVSERLKKITTQKRWNSTSAEKCPPENSPGAEVELMDRSKELTTECRTWDLAEQYPQNTELWARMALNQLRKLTSANVGPLKRQNRPVKADLGAETGYER